MTSKLEKWLQQITGTKYETSFQKNSRSLKLRSLWASSTWYENKNDSHPQEIKEFIDVKTIENGYLNILFQLKEKNKRTDSTVSKVLSKSFWNSYACFAVNSANLTPPFCKIVAVSGTVKTFQPSPSKNVLRRSCYLTILLNYRSKITAYKQLSNLAIRNLRCL